MKIYQELDEIAERTQAQAELDRVIKKLNEVSSLMDKNTDYMSAAVNRLQDELNEALKKQDAAQAELVAEEMRGKSTAETAKKVQAAISEVERINSTLEAFARTGGMALYILEKKFKDLEFKRGTWEREMLGRERINASLSSTTAIMKPADKKKLIEEAEQTLTAIKADIAPIKKAIETLKANRLKHGNLISADADTAKAAQTAFDIAGDAWSTRERLKENLVQQLESTHQEIQRLKTSAYLIEEAIGEVDPEHVGEYVWSYDISIAVMPELFQDLDKLARHAGELSYHMDMAKRKVKWNIKERGSMRKLSQAIFLAKS